MASQQDRLTWVTDMVAISGRLSSNRFEALAKNHTIDIIINLDEESHPFESDMANRLQIDYKFENIIGYSTPSQQQLTKVVRWIKRGISNGKKVLVHCSKGSGRSPTVASAFLIYEGMSVDEALDKIKKKRTMAFNKDKVTTERIIVLRQFEKGTKSQKAKN